MGLDIALGAVILIAAIRGWLRGFVSQAVRLAGFVGCFYLADVARDQARPYVLDRFPKIEPELMDRLLWWVCAVVCYVATVGLVTLAIKLSRRPDPSGSPGARRDNQFAGFLFGAAKGALVAVFLAAGVHKYARDVPPQAEWLGRQLEGSFALQWTQEHQPAPRIWESPPVRRFVEHIRRNGLGHPATAEPTDAPEDEPTELRAASDFRKPPPLEWAAGDDPDPDESLDPHPELDLDPEFVEELEGYRADRSRR